MKKLLLLAVLALNLSLQAQLHKTTKSDHQCWVSASGNDSWDGSQAHPFRTLLQAKNWVRKSVHNANSDIVVNIVGGTYRLKKKLVFTSEDGGQNGHRVIYRAVPGASPVISGAIQITRWQPTDTIINSGTIWKAWVGKGIRSRQLYVNGKRAVRAQTQSYDQTRNNKYPVQFRPSYRSYGTKAMNGGIEYSVSQFNSATWRDPKKWTNVKDIEAVCVTQWKMMSVPLDTIFFDTVKSKFTSLLGKVGLITLQQPGWINANLFRSDSNTGPPGIWSFWQITRFENAFEFLDTAGEWYLNRHTGWIYYMPRQGENMHTATVELPVLDTLMDISGSPTKAASNLTFEGITYTYATWTATDSANGYVDDQSGFHITGLGHETNTFGHVKNVTPTPGNIRLSYAHNINFSGDTFTHMGAVAVYFEEGCQNNIITHSYFNDISSASIQIGGVSVSDAHPQPADSCSHNTISYNTISQTGREYVDAAGIMIGFTSYTTINNNSLTDMPWSGIAMGWGWGLYDTIIVGGKSTTFPGVPGASAGLWGTFNTPSANHDNKILHNDISNFMNCLWDGGAVYTTGFQGTAQHPLLITGNKAHDKYPNGGSNIYYTDGGSRYIILDSNTAENNSQGHLYFGAIPGSADLLNYSIFKSVLFAFLDSLPYGAEIGGCVTYGDITYKNNQWQNHWVPGTLYDSIAYFLFRLDSLQVNTPPYSHIYFDPCLKCVFGQTHPDNLVFDSNTIISQTFSTTNNATKQDYLKLKNSILSKYGGGPYFYNKRIIYNAKKENTLSPPQK